MAIKTLSILLGISVLLMFLDNKRVLEPEKEAVYKILIPFQYSFYQTKLAAGDFFSFITFWKSGEARIKNLELRNLELVAYKNKAERLKLENDDLRRQLGATASAGKKLIPVMVVNAGQYLEIDAAGFEGKNVIYLDNLVGKIVKSHFVQLPTDSQFKIPVRVGKILGVVSGQFNSSIILDKIAPDEEIKIDDLVVTTQDGYLLGKIAKIVSSKTDVFQKAIISPLINYKKLPTVFVQL